MSIKDISSLADAAELQHFNNASMKVIKDLQQKIAQLEAENESLKVMLEQNIPSLININDQSGISNEEMICLTQIALLKEKAVSSKTQLTMEEVKKLEILTKVQATLRSTPQRDPEEEKLKKMSPDELLRLINSNE